MYDTIYNDQFPPGAAAYAAYVDGGIGDQPNYAFIVSTFPKAQHLSISLFGNNADALDVESGAATPSQVPAWCAAQRKRGIQRPCVYASASTMNDEILPTLSQAGIARSTVRLWTAHYDVGQHICGPGSCGALSVNADGTQWTPNAVVNGATLVLDQSLLLENFFTTDPDRHHGGGIAVRNAEQRQERAHRDRGGAGDGAPDRVRLRQRRPGPAAGQAPGRDLRPRAGWHVTKDLVVDGNKGLTHLAFPDPSKTGAISINRADAGTPRWAAWSTENNLGFHRGA